MSGVQGEISLPPWLSVEPAIVDDSLVFSASTELQGETAEECLPLLLGEEQDSLLEVNEFGLPRLMRKKHIRFLQQALGRLPAPYTGLDASRPWMYYWCSMGLYLLGYDVSAYREEFGYSLVTSLRPIQNKTGGFGGGNRQFSHLATTYAAVLSLATVGGVEAWELIDREAMWHWLGRLKLPTGEFQVTEGGEIDVRGAFCAMVLVSLLNLPVKLPDDSPARINGDETFMTGLAEWVSNCQNYEGGLGSAPGCEAHGAYAFCALACLCVLGDPKEMFAKYLDLPALISWLTARQHPPEGGLGGRANKLVDGCYSHWIGGCWSLAEAACRNDSITPSLFNREGLTRYILCCAQEERGGLRDKPSKNPDAYHTLYNLAGLNSAQNNYTYDGSIISGNHPLRHAFGWTAEKTFRQGSDSRMFDEEDRLPLMHPIYIIPYEAVGQMRTYFKTRLLS